MIRVQAAAKINLTLSVGPLRGDGYHDLTTIYTAISLYDQLTAEPSDELSLTISGEGAESLPLGEDNLVLRAAQAVASRIGITPWARLTLRKQIPVAAGLAGGSADAAAALVACNQLWNGGLSAHELGEIAAQLGSDVPFALVGGLALGSGRGEQLSTLNAANQYHWVIAAAEGELSTPQVYRQLDHLRLEKQLEVTQDLHHDSATVIAALNVANPMVLASALHNDLQPAAISLRPKLAAELAAGKEAGALAAMISGSGPTSLFLTHDAAHAHQITRILENTAQFRWVRAVHSPVTGVSVLPLTADTQESQQHV